MSSLAVFYEALGDTRVQARKLTRASLLRDFSPGASIVFRVWMASRDFADAHGVKELPVAALSPRDETARAWVDRCVAIVRAWRTDVENGARTRERRTSSRQA